MADPQTINRGYAVPTRGSDVGTWDVPLNGDFNLIDQNLGAITTVSLSNTSVTLTASQYACGTIVLTGALTNSVSVSWPSVQGWWTVSNQTTGNFYVQLVCGAGRRICVDQGSTWDIQMDGTNAMYRNFPPVGTYLDITDATVPLWISGCSGALPYLNCDGSTFSGSTYPYLATKLGGTTLPDLRGGMRATLNQGTSRITTVGSGINGDARFSRGGAQNIALTVDQLAQHQHPFSGTTNIESNDHTHQISYSFISGAVTSGGNQGTYPSGSSPTSGQSDHHTHAFSGTTNLVGSSNPHNNMPPTTIAGITLIRAG